MEKLDRNLQKRVWERVYAQPQTPRLRQQQRQNLQQALRRSEANLAVYEKMATNETYGDAFCRLAADTAEHIKMLRQMLRA